MQYIYDAVGLIAEHMHVLVNYEEMYIRQLSYMATYALKIREDKAKRASQG